LHLGAPTGLSRFMHGLTTRSVMLIHCVSRKLAHLCRNGQSSYALISFKQGHDNPVEHIALDRVHNRLATVARGGLRVWDMANDRRLFQLLFGPRPSHYWVDRFPKGLRMPDCCDAIFGQMRAILRQWGFFDCLLFRKSWGVCSLFTLRTVGIWKICSIVYNVQPFTLKWKTRISTRMFVGIIRPLFWYLTAPSQRLCDLFKRSEDPPHI
jgi:hypothetical protein